MRSASTQFLIPAVLRVRMYVSAKEARTGRLTLSRRNIMLRDKCTCQCAPMPAILETEALLRGSRNQVASCLHTCGAACAST